MHACTSTEPCGCIMQRGEQAEEPPDEGPAVAKQGRKRAWESRDSGSDSEEAERERDRQAKDEFEERLKARDEARTRHIAEARLSKSELEVSNLHSMTHHDCLLLCRQFTSARRCKAPGTAPEIACSS